MKDNIWDRRRFLKAAVAGIAGAGAFALSNRPTDILARALNASAIEEGTGLKRPVPALSNMIEEESFEGRPSALDDDPFDAPEILPVSVKRRLRFFNIRTGEKLDVTYRDLSGKYDLDALSSINRFLRCPFTRREARIDVKVIEFLNAIDKSFGGNNEIYIISGYRTPEYHKWLRRHGKRPARNSLHLVGKAIDFRIPGIRLRNVKREALRMKFGGVGYYPRRGFVHIDSGRFRYW